MMLLTAGALQEFRTCRPARHNRRLIARQEPAGVVRRYDDGDPLIGVAAVGAQRSLSVTPNCWSFRTRIMTCRGRRGPRWLTPCVRADLAELGETPTPRPRT